MALVATELQKVLQAVCASQITFSPPSPPEGTEWEAWRFRPFYPRTTTTYPWTGSMLLCALALSLTSCDGQHPLLCMLRPQRLCFLQPLLIALTLHSSPRVTMCGLGCKKYVEANISHKSRTAVKYTMKTLASCAETVIFMLLGISAVDSSKWAWDSGLVLGTLFFILFFRALGIAGTLCFPILPALAPPPQLISHSESTSLSSLCCSALPALQT